MLPTLALALVWLCWPPATALAAVPPAVSPGISTALSPAEAVDLAIESDADSVYIVLEGEAIGEALAAPRGKRWVNLRGGGVGLGVVVDRADAESIPLFGEYRQRGATVRIEGTVQRACAEHGGDLDVHAHTFEILDQGETIEHEIHPTKSIVAVVSVPIMAALWWRYRRLRRNLFLR